MSIIFFKIALGGAWLTQLVECATPNLRILSSNPTLGMEPT